MAKQELIKIEGVVTLAKKGGRFDVTVDGGHIVNCTLSGKIRKNTIKIVLGDVVDIEISPYDLSNGRIVFRH